MLSKREKGTVAYLLLRTMGVIVSLVMVACMIAGAFSRPVLAETTDTVAYSAVDGDSATITDKDGSTQTVYGIGSGSIVSSDKAVGGDYADVRVKTVATDDAEHLGNDMTRGLIAGVLYYGYPKNATGMNASYADTQKAVDLAFDFAGEDLPESDAITDGAAALYKAALAEPVTGATLYRYAPVAENDNEKYPIRSMVGAAFSEETKAAFSTEDVAKKTAANAVTKDEAPQTEPAAGSGVSTQADPTLTISFDPATIEPAAGQTVTMKLTYSGLTENSNYEVVPSFKAGTTELTTFTPATGTIKAAAGGSGAENVTFTLDASARQSGEKIDVEVTLREPDARTSIGPATGSITVQAAAQTYPINISRVSKDWETGEYKGGVTLTIKDADGNVVKDASGNDLTWETSEVATEAPHVVYLEGGESAEKPKEYIITDSERGDITLTIDEKGEPTIYGDNVGIDDQGGVVIGDEVFSVLITKTDERAKALKGARLKVVDSDNKTVSTWTSTTEAEELSLWADTYTLTETKAPTNYQRITTKIKFKVDENGKVTLQTKKVNGSGKISASKGEGSEVTNHIKLQNAKKTSASSTTRSTTTKKADTTKAKNAKTGDDNPIAFLITMLAVAAMTIVVFSRGRAQH